MYNELNKNDEPFQLSGIQTAYFVGRDKKYELGGVSCHYYTEIESKLDVQKLNNSLQKVIRRHPMLRAILLPDGRQCVLKTVPRYNLDTIDISHLDHDTQQEYILRERQRMSHDVFKADQWPLFEFKAFKISKDTIYLFIGIDFLVADALSIQIITGELMHFYNNPGIPLPELRYTFKDFIAAHNERKKSDAYKNDKEFWLNQLDHFPLAPDLFLKVKPSGIRKPRFKRLSKYFSIQYRDALKKKCREKNIRPSVVFCTAYAEVLAFWSNQPHFAVNFTVSNRYPDDSDINNVVGDFTSVMLIEVNLESKTTFWEKAQGIQDTLANALAHGSYEGVEFIRELTRFNHLGNKPAVPVVFTSLMSGDFQEGWSQLGEIKYGITQTPQVYLDNQVAKSADSINIRWDYVEQLFDEKVIEMMFEQYIGILLSIIDTKNDFKLEISEEDKKFICLYNSTGEDIAPSTLHGMFTRQAALTPDNIAVVLEDCSITYKELDEISDRTAGYLKEQGVAEGDMVGILAAREIGSIINIIGVLKAGAVYVPVNPGCPEERRNYMFENCKCKLILEPQMHDTINLNRYDSRKPGIKYNPGDIAYIIYTSGSTGRPKGVVITHGAASNTIMDINRKFHVNHDDRIIGVSSLCFDLSVYDIFGAFSTGAALVMVPDQRDAVNLARVVREKKITIWNSVPAILDITLEIASKEFKNDGLRLVLLSGDWIPLKLPGKIRENCKDVEIISLGGATEASIWSIYYPIKEIKKEWKSVPYGMPLANQEFYVLNFQKQLCPPGVQGELYIGGKGVALGYYNDKKNTGNSFIHHPELGYIYKTGDYGVLHRQGHIEFLGRRDQQVKIGGYRIELDEIQNRLLAHQSIKNAVVTGLNDKDGKKFMCSYIAADIKINVDELRSYLLEELPAYMVPAYFIQVDDIPLTSNGKIDRRTLPAPQPGLNDGVEMIAPRNQIQQLIAGEWKKVLELDQVSIKDSFFSLGGDSLKAIQLVSRLSTYFDIGVNQVFENPTIEEIALNVSYKGNNIEAKLDTLKERMSNYIRAAAQDDNRHKYRLYCRQNEKYKFVDLENKNAHKNILVTGSTGFLGSYIVRDILERTGYNLYLTVRGSSLESAARRLEESLTGYFGNDFFAKHRERIFIIAADLSKDYFDIPGDSYHTLANQIDCVINAAANVKHFGLYNDFHRVNVKGVERLIEFCLQGKIKDLHHISTTGLSLFSAKNRKSMLYTENDIDVGQEYGNYYLATKFEAEKLAVESRKKGINTNIYRVGVLVFDSKSGVFQRNIEENAFYNNLKSYIKLGSVPGMVFGQIDFSFIDYVSKAITLIFDKSELLNEVYHVYNPNPSTWPEIAKMLRNEDISLRVKSFDDFLDFLYEILEKEKRNVYADDLLFNYSIYENIINLPEIVCDKTQKILRRLGFEWPILNEMHVKKMVRHCREVNFI
jgi:amino acid adenylation domain-containing protein/thioester reductase-like protein